MTRAINPQTPQYNLITSWGQANICFLAKYCRNRWIALLSRAFNIGCFWNQKNSLEEASQNLVPFSLLIFIMSLAANMFKCPPFQVLLLSYMYIILESVIYCCNLQTTLENKICLSKVFLP